MRVFTVMTSAVIAMTLLGACSGSPQSGSAVLPASALNVTGQPNASRAATSIVTGIAAKMRLLQQQAEGKVIGPWSQAVSKNVYNYMTSHAQSSTAAMRRTDGAHPLGGQPQMWFANPEGDVVVGTDSTGTKALRLIATEPDGCYSPNTLKSSSSGNIYAACELTTSDTGGAELEFNASGSTLASYIWQVSPPCPAGDFCSIGAYDGGPDDLGHVYSELSIYAYYNCAATCGQVYSTPGFFWWNEGDASATPTFIPAPGNANVTIQVVEYMATDATGTLWFNYGGCTTAATPVCGYGIGEISTPTTNPTFTEIAPPGALVDAGGIAINKSTIALTDQGTNYTYLYQLPLTPTSLPYSVLGPTPSGLDPFIHGYTISGNFSRDGLTLAHGDGAGWLDFTGVRNNSESTAASIYTMPITSGVVYAQ